MNLPRKRKSKSKNGGSKDVIAATISKIPVTSAQQAIKLRKLINNEWMLVLAGIASVAFGVVLLLQPAAGALVLIWWVGAYALLFGILLVVLAFRMRSLGKRSASV